MKQRLYLGLHFAESLGTGSFREAVEHFLKCRYQESRRRCAWHEGSVQLKCILGTTFLGIRL